MKLSIQPSGPVNFDLSVPGSKSLTNRALICASLAQGASVISNASSSDDSRHLIGSLTLLGIDIAERPDQIRIEGQEGRFTESHGHFSVGNAGTALRFLASLLCLGRGHFVLDGDERMRERPIGGLVDGLKQLGAHVGYDARSGFPPLVIDAAGLRGGRAAIAGDTSSQFISSILMAAPYATNDVELETAGDVASKPYIDMTIGLMKDFGVEVRRDGYRRFLVQAGSLYRGRPYVIEGDAAGAGYFLAMAAATRGRAVVRGLGYDSCQGELGFIRVLGQMGCSVKVERGFVEVKGGDLRGVDVDMNDMPDSVQTLAVVSLFASGTTRIRNIANLRIKETDRIAALANELGKLGAEVTAREDMIEIEPGPLRPGEIETYNDHRMALSFSVAAVASPGVVILGPDCVSKSFPGYFEKLRSLGLTLREDA